MWLATSMQSRSNCMPYYLFYLEIYQLFRNAMSKKNPKIRIGYTENLTIFLYIVGLSHIPNYYYHR